MARGGGARLPCSPSPTLTPLPRRAHESLWGRGGVGGAQVASGGQPLTFPRGDQPADLGLCLLLPESLWFPEPPSSRGRGGGETAPKMAPAPPRRRPARGKGGEGCSAAPPPPRLALLPGADRCEALRGEDAGRWGRGASVHPRGGEGGTEDPRAAPARPGSGGGRERGRVFGAGGRRGLVWQAGESEWAEAGDRSPRGTRGGRALLGWCLSSARPLSRWCRLGGEGVARRA